MKKAIIVIAHGSREKTANRDFFDLLKRFKKYTEAWVEGAFLEMISPAIDDAIAACVKKKTQQIILVPLLLFKGKHIQKDIPEALARAKMKHPELDFHLASPLYDHPLLLKIVKEKSEKVLIRGRNRR